MSDSKLAPPYTFNDFVVGDSNRSAYNVAAAVALGKSNSPNPLFIYGAVGTGKTHLIRAIGNASPLHRVCYRTSEEFANAIIGACRSNTMSDFQTWIETLDVLLIDDIHFLSGKERTQQEFLRMFETLVCHSKQVVVTANRSPKKLRKINGSLIKWFESGLVACIDTTDRNMLISVFQEALAVRVAFRSIFATHFQQVINTPKMRILWFASTRNIAAIGRNSLFSRPGQLRDADIAD